MKLVSFSDKKIIEYLNRHFISIAVDTDMEKTLADKWKVKGLPLMWFLKSDSSKISHLPGYVEKDYLLMIFKYIQTQAYDKMSLHEFIEEQ